MNKDMRKLQYKEEGKNTLKKEKQKKGRNIKMKNNRSRRQYCESDKLQKQHKHLQ